MNDRAMKTSELPRSPTGAGLFILINPSSGRIHRRQDPRALLDRRLPEAATHLLADGEDLQDVLRDALASPAPPTALGVYGGDGSVVAAAEVAFHAQLPLLVLPGGTFNHFALTIGVSDLDSGISALQHGTGSFVDLAEIDFGDGDRILALNTLSVGVYPDFVQYRTRIETRLGRPLATIVADVRAVMTATPLEVTLDGKRIHVWSLFIGVDRFSPPRGAPLKREGFADGVLDVRILPSTLRSRGRGFFTLLNSRPRARRDGGPDPMFGARLHAIVATRTALTLRTTGRGGEVYAHDGEVRKAPVRILAENRKVVVRVIPAALQVYLPDEPAGW